MIVKVDADTASAAPNDYLTVLDDRLVRVRCRAIDVYFVVAQFLTRIWIVEMSVWLRARGSSKHSAFEVARSQRACGCGLWQQHARDVRGCKEPYSMHWAVPMHVCVLLAVL